MTLGSDIYPARFDSAPGHQEYCITRQAFTAWRFFWACGHQLPRYGSAPEALQDGVLNREDAPRVIIIADPNGAGKTTFAREFFPYEADCRAFVNADLIAAGISPFAPEAAALRAGRLMLEELSHHFATHTSFAFETTLSGKGSSLDREMASLRLPGKDHFPAVGKRR